MVNSAVKRDLDILSCGISWQNGVLHVIVRYGALLFLCSRTLFIIWLICFLVLFSMKLVIECFGLVLDLHYLCGQRQD